MFNQLARTVEQTFRQVMSIGRIRVSMVSLRGTDVDALPVRSTAGDTMYAQNGRKNGEGVGAGTGVLVFFDGTNWIACDSGQTVSD